MDTNELIPTLALVTLGLGLAAGVGGLLYFLRRRSNRDAAARVFRDD
jgi:LPXTG-motif cell wall-anchored protein